MRRLFIATALLLPLFAGSAAAEQKSVTAGQGSESATLTIVDGDSTSPQSVALTGTAPALFNVSPTSLPFTASAVNTATAPQTLTITNGRATAVTYTSATVTSTGGFAGDFGGFVVLLGFAVGIDFALIAFGGEFAAKLQHFVVDIHGLKGFVLFAVEDG